MHKRTFLLVLTLVAFRSPLVGQDLTIVSDPNLDGWIGGVSFTMSTLLPILGLADPISPPNFERYSARAIGYVSFDLTPLNGKKITIRTLQRKQLIISYYTRRKIDHTEFN